MKARVYLRIAKNEEGRGDYPFKVAANVQPNNRPLSAGGYLDKTLPTLAFGVDLDIPDEAFDQAAQVIAEIKIPADQLEIAAEVTQ